MKSGVGRFVSGALWLSCVLGAACKDAPTKSPEPRPRPVESPAHRGENPERTGGDNNNNNSSSNPASARDGVATARRARFVDDIPGVDTTGLSPSARQAFLRIMNDDLCACSHPHTAAVCLADKDHCTEATRIGRFVVRKFRRGATEKETAHAVNDIFGEKPRRNVFTLKGLPRKGPADAKVTVVEFSDFQCPMCKLVQAPLKELLAGYGGKVAYYGRHYPLPHHAFSALAAEAAEAAGAQGKYWEMKETLFANQERLSRDEILRIAGELKLDVGRFTRDLDAKKFAAAVEASRREGQAAGVKGTPSFFVNGVLVKHMHSIETLRDWIDAALEN
jgi:predicted DsbA family dithiol-disulfide isomerase